MPIFRKNTERVLFVHIPKTAGVSVTHWFIKNYWYVTNFSFFSHDKKLMIDNFGIHTVPLEGVQKQNVSPQHVEAKIYSQWGAFTSAFVIVRHPIDRLFSELKYRYTAYLSTGQLKEDSESVFQSFVHNHIDRMLDLATTTHSINDNHFRPQTDFLAQNVKIIRFEDDWKSFIKNMYNLKSPIPHYNNLSKFKYQVKLNDKLYHKVIDFYKKDFKTLGYKL